MMMLVMTIAPATIQRKGSALMPLATANASAMPASKQREKRQLLIRSITWTMTSMKLNILGVFVPGCAGAALLT